MEAPQKSENSKSVSNHNASCCPVTDVFFCEKTRIKRKQHVENISQMYNKNSEDSVKEAVTRKHYQHILLKVHDADLAAREAHYHATGLSERLQSRG